MTNFNHAEFIRATIGDQIPEQYQAYVERLAGAYERRDSAAIEAILRAGRQGNVPEVRVEAALQDAGLRVREPVNAPRPASFGAVQAQGPGTTTDLEGQVRDLSRTVGQLVDAARRNGITIS